jgi:chromosome segregation ATPase
LSKNNETLSSNLEKIIKEMEKVKLERDECEALRLDSAKKHEVNMKALNQNLANLRGEIKHQNEKLEQTEMTINSIKGDNLEMEAKLSNCMDDRNQLLERCLISEKLLESTKSHNIELKRRLEDAQSALQELGREHQELQVTFNFISFKGAY